MTESMNLDSADIVGSLEGFDTSLDTSLEAEFEMLNHSEHITVNEIDITADPLAKVEIQVEEEVVKEEIVENMEEEITEEQLMEETITYDDVNITSHVIESVMDIVEDGTYHNEDEQNSLTVSHETSEIQNDNEIFSDRVIGEEIVSDEQVIENEPHIYEDSESEKEFQDLNDMMQDNIVNEETVIDESEVMETEGHGIENEKKYDPNNLMSPDVYIVQPHGGSLTQQSILQTNAIIAPKENKVTRVVVPATDTGQPQTIRIVAPQGKIVGSAPKTITLAQAKQMGLLNLNQIIQPSSKGGVGKLVVPKKTVTVMKSPTKILPAPPTRSQKVVIRGAGGSLKAGTLLTTGTTPTGVIRIPATQAAQLHLPATNKQVQFVKLVGSSKTGAGATLVPVQTLSTKSIPVALPTSLLNSSQAFKVVPFTSQATTGQPQTATVTGTQRVLIPASTAQVVSSTVVPNQQTSKHSIVMFQPQLISQVKETHSFDENMKSSSETETMFTQEKVVPTVSAVRATTTTTNGKKVATSNIKVKEEVIVKTEPKSEPDLDVVEANGIRPRKPCNCTKSMCLKLYCDCFANGEFCHQCNCTTCYNNLIHEEERQRAIKSCLERNPTAFRPKIGKTYVGSEERRHNKGCNCRRSGCLKNYCECYEAKIPCSKNCKCVGCKNTEGLLKRGLTCEDIDKLAFREKSDSSSVTRNSFDTHHIPGHRQVLNLMSPQLVEATCQCLVAQVEEWARSGSTDLDLAQALVIEELGRCLAQLIECINKSLSQIPQSAS